MEKLGLGEAVDDQPARARAVRRVEALADMSRDAIEAYVALARAELRARLEDHLALAVDHQVRLLASPGFRDRVNRTLR
jgi:hypothetical protein